MNLAVCHQKLNQNKVALEYFEIALKMDPHNRAIHKTINELKKSSTK